MLALSRRWMPNIEKWNTKEVIWYIIPGLFDLRIFDVGGKVNEAFDIALGRHWNVSGNPQKKT